MSYQLRYREDPRGEFTNVTVNSTMTTLINLLPKTTYKVQIRANNSIISSNNATINNNTETRSEHGYTQVVSTFLIRPVHK